MTPKQHLNKLALDALQAKHPKIHPENLAKPSYTDKTANGLTKMIIDWLRLNGHQAERISTTGRYVDNSQIVTNSMGQVRKIGSGKWIKGSGTKGSADVSSTMLIRFQNLPLGISVKWEVKMKDKQSKEQAKYEADIKASGGHYYIVRTFNEVYEIYNNILNQYNV